MGIPKLKFTPEQKAGMAAAYASLGIDAIGKRYGVSKSVVSRILDEQAVVRRPSGVPAPVNRLKKPELDREGIIKDFESGSYSKKALAKKYNCSSTTIRTLVGVSE